LEEVIITPKKPNKPILPKEKIIIPDEKPEDLFNPYSPVGDPIANFGGSSTNQLMSSDINDPNSSYNRNVKPDRY
jgi:hypothetical protein